jgi:primosomal protein N' (replication factor Y)
VAPGRRQQEAIAQRFLDGETDILVATQLVAGALSGAQLLGVVSVDATLHFPDFRAGERTLQFLDGLLRRLGPQGRVVLQSFTPGHYALACLVSGDHAGFYRQELAMRRQLGYPPFRRLARVVVVGPASPPHKLAEAIRTSAPGEVEVLGPAPGLQPFRGGRPRWSILLRGDESAQLAGVLREAWGAWSARDLGQMTVDVDPLDLS